MKTKTFCTIVLLAICVLSVVAQTQRYQLSDSSNMSIIYFDKNVGSKVVICAPNIAQTNLTWIYNNHCSEIQSDSIVLDSTYNGSDVTFYCDQRAPITFQFLLVDSLPKIYFKKSHLFIIPEKDEKYSWVRDSIMILSDTTPARTGKRPAWLKKLDRDWEKRNRMDKKFLFSFDSLSQEFIAEYKKYMAGSRPNISTNSELQQALLTNMRLFVPVIDSLRKEIRTWKYGKESLYFIYLGMSDFIFILQGGLSEKSLYDHIPMEDGRTIEVLSTLNAVLHNMDLQLFLFPYFDHSKP